jgi:hypothetical protein
MSWIARTSGGVSRDGEVRGQDDWSSSAHACCRRRQVWNRTRRHPQEPQEGPQRYTRAGTIHRAQDPDLVASVRQALFGEAKLGGSEQGQHQPKEHRELLDASTQLQDLLSELRLREVRPIQTDHDRRRDAQPPTRRRARDAEVRGDGHISSALDVMPKAMVVALLRTACGRHGPDHRPFPHAAQPPQGRWGGVARRDDNSRPKVRNVRGDSSAERGAWCRRLGRRRRRCASAEFSHSTRIRNRTAHRS